MLKPLIFVHVPKTAGTTFLNILKKNYKGKNIFTVDGLKIKESLEIFNSLSITEKNNFDLIQGHFTLDLHKQIPDKKFDYVCFLRDPIDLFISTYYYIRRTKEHNYYEEVNKMSFEEYIDFRRNNNQDNMQTRHLSGSATDMSYNDINYDQEGEKYFQIAKENISIMINHVLITEKFDESLIYLKEKAGFNYINYTRSNVTKDRPKSDSFTKDILKKVAELNHYDILLYNIALENFNKKISELNINWTKELNNLKTKNEVNLNLVNIKSQLKKIIKKIF